MTRSLNYFLKIFMFAQLLLLLLGAMAVNASEILGKNEVAGHTDGAIVNNSSLSTKAGDRHRFVDKAKVIGATIPGAQWREPHH